MPVTFPVHSYRAEVAQIVQLVFETMLNLNAEPLEQTWSPRPDSVTSAIYFAGEWKGAVLLECTVEQAICFTARLMPIPPPDSMNDDVRDAMGELINMLAGNLKSVVPHGVGISMPSVVEGQNYSLRVCGHNSSDRIAFLTPAGLIWVMLVEVKE